MRPHDPDPPVHDISGLDDRERILADALALAEEHEERYRITFPESPPRRRGKGLLTLVVLALTCGVVLAPPAWLRPAPAPIPTPAQRERGERLALLLQAAQVEGFRARHGRLPDSLADVSVRLSGLRYVRSNSRVYQIVGSGPDGRPLVYDSARPHQGLNRELAAWLGMASR